MHLFGIFPQDSGGMYPLENTNFLFLANHYKYIHDYQYLIRRGKGEQYALSVGIAAISTGMPYLSYIYHSII